MRTQGIVSSRHRPRRASVVKLRKNGKNKIDAASTIAAPVSFGMNRLLKPQSRFNWLLPSVAAITPQYIEMTLRGALAGNHIQQYELFDLMLRTWPELSACTNELIEGVLRKKIIYEPFHEEDEKPTPAAIEKMKLVSAALRTMDPDTVNDGNDLEGTLKNILDGWFRGVSVSEIVWNTVDTTGLGMITAPRTTFWVQPVQYAFATDNMIGFPPYRGDNSYGNYPFTVTSPNQTIVEPFPPNKFLVAIHKSKAGSPLGGPLLVPLAWWWCAANFSSDWLLNLAQLFGLPFRWATYEQNAPAATIDAVCQMLQNMGSAGWAAFPDPTKLELISSSKEGSDHSPQGELLDRADRYARLLILGQTMTGTHGTTGKGGGQAFGVVEHNVKEDRIDAAGRFAANVINRQLVPAILALNYGNAEEPPRMKFLEDEVAGLQEAQRDKTLVDAGMVFGIDYLRKKYDIPEPADGEEIIGGPKPIPDPFGGFVGQGGQPQDPNAPTSPDVNNEPAKASEFKDPRDLEISVVDNQIIRGYMERIERGEQLSPVVLSNTHPRRIKDGNHRAAAYKKLGLQVPCIKAGDKPGHAFHGNQYINIGERVNTLHGQGIVVAQNYHNLWVSTNKGIKVIPRNQATKIPKIDEKKFPSITHSAEAERRAALNKQLASKLEKLNDIEDDAVFSRELVKLSEEIHAS